MKKTFLILTTILLLNACSLKMYVPTEENRTTDVPLTDLKAGRTLYIKQCSNCHDLHFPDEYSHDDWVFELNKMQARAKINDAQKELILKYLWNAPQKTRKH